MKIASYIGALITALIFGFIGVICIQAGEFGPMFTGYLCLFFSGIIFLAIFIDGVEQIMNAYTVDDKDIDDRDHYGH